MSVMYILYPLSIMLLQQWQEYFSQNLILAGTALTIPKNNILREAFDTLNTYGLEFKTLLHKISVLHSPV